MSIEGSKTISCMSCCNKDPDNQYVKPQILPENKTSLKTEGDQRIEKSPNQSREQLWILQDRETTSEAKMERMENHRAESQRRRTWKKP
eukprot:scaffold24532_cov157-Cylindrotheca_fusiformis.AAC.5